MSVIRSVEELRSVIGEEIPGLNEKNIDHLDSYAIEFIKKSPFLVLTTSDAQGRCDASPKGDAPGFVHGGRVGDHRRDGRRLETRKNVGYHHG